jgi:hypothetical protein
MIVPVKVVIVMPIFVMEEPLLMFLKNIGD